ncbi:MAG: hypothetical protein JNL08_17805 [Planctomycetes bacterium]|nr:hypothetical protein [Planctomycetota bacterium]
MKWLPDSLSGRLLLAFVGAAAAIAVLAISVRQRDAVRAAERRATVPAAEPAAPVLAVVVAPVRGNVRLAQRFAALAPDVAPVVQVFADGTAAVRRPAPLPRSPGGAVVTGDAGIVLPAPSLAALTPAARGTVVELIGRLVGSRPVPVERVRAVDLSPADAELVALLQWVP